MKILIHHIRAVPGRLAVMIVVALALVADNGHAQDVTAFANPNACPVDDLDLASMELVASGVGGSYAVRDRPYGAPPVIVTFDPLKNTLMLSPEKAEAAGSVEVELIDGPLAAWPVRVTAPSGTVTALLAPELGVAELSDGSGNYVSARKGVSPLFDRISAPEISPDVLELIRGLLPPAPPLEPGCAGAAKWCGKYVGRMIGPGFICAASIGTDGDSCNAANEGKCAWCECKGYDCRNC